MTDHKFTDDEVIKALECIANEKDVLCAGCEYKKYDGLACHRIGARNALALINRQKASIQEVITLNSKLEAENAKLQRLLDFYEETSGNKKAKAEAIKEFAEKLKKKIYPYNGVDKKKYAINAYAVEKTIEGLVKEMTEENNESKST